MQALLDKLTAVGGLLRVRALVTMTLTAAVVYLYVSENPVPAELLNAWFFVGGIYWGSRIAQDNSAPPPSP